MEVKPPVPQIPPANWSEFKDLQEREKYHQARAGTARSSEALTEISDAITHRPGGWLAHTSHY